MSCVSFDGLVVFLICMMDYFVLKITGMKADGLETVVLFKRLNSRVFHDSFSK